MPEKLPIRQVVDSWRISKICAIHFDDGVTTTREILPVDVLAIAVQKFINWRYINIPEDDMPLPTSLLTAIRPQVPPPISY